MTDAVFDYQAQDDATRARIREALDRTMFVEAGAGTGKTSALVDRIVALVLDGHKIERLIAITFTDKAAAEMRDRVRSGLEEARTSSPDKADRIDAALGSLDRARISTIHSFCQSLLYSFAAEAGIDPSFTVQEEVQADRRFRERWRMYLEQLAADRPAVSVIDRALSLGLTPGNIETLAAELTNRAELAYRLSANPLTAPAPLWPDIEPLERDLETLLLGPAPPGDRLRQRVEKLLALVGRLLERNSDRESILVAEMKILKERQSATGNAGNWGGNVAIQRARATAQRISDRLLDILEACRTEALAGLMPLLVRFVLEDARERGREGVLSFDDLILRLRDLLRGSPRAVHSLRQSFEVMLIDEFQDTDPLQVEIALAFAVNPATGLLDHGRLFLVGDPKQSIYRFRRADMAIYSRARESVLQQGAEPADLALNRRSRPVILDWVNSVFAKLIGEGADPAVQPPYHAIHSSRREQPNGPGVAWFGGETSKDMKAREVRRLEAQAVAAHCRAALDEAWEVLASDGSVRPASFRDIAVLIPTRNVLIPLERAFGEAGIPFRIEGGSLIFRTQEVRDLINCFAAIDDPKDEVAIVGALRSPAFACSDVDLARHKAAGGSFDYLRAAEPAAGGQPVTEALRVLAEYHHGRHQQSLAALVEGFAGERGLIEVGLLDQDARDGFRRVRFIVEQARAFEAAGPESLRAFVSWLEQRSGDAIRDNEGAGVDDDEDAVRILTIHGAKGLEFPIVFMAGLGSAPNNRTDAYTADLAGDRIAVCIGAKTHNARFELGPVDELSHLEKAHTAAEYARLLYVAATRARDHLIVSLFHPAKASECGARRLIEANAREYAGERPELPAALTGRVTPFADLKVERPENLNRDDFQAGRDALVVMSTRKRFTSATALGQMKKEETSDESEPWARGRGGTHLGRAVHAAIQSLPLDADDDLIDAFSRAQAVAEAIPHRSDEVARLVRWVLRSSQAAARARGASRALSEVPFAVEHDGVVLEGFIDLVIETPDGIEIVDWKTDQISAGDVQERLREYETQAGLYVYGIESATGRHVSRVTYVFAGPRVEVSPGEPAALANAARAELARIGRVE